MRRRRLLRGPLDIACAAWLVLLVLAAAFADLLPLSPHDDPSLTLRVPSFLPPDLFSANPLGTNALGLDLLARSIYGARGSLATSIFAATVALLVGTIIGSVAGYVRGWFDRVISILTDSLMAIPGILLLVTIASVSGRPTSLAQAVFGTGLALALLGLPAIIRLSRAHAVRLAGREFVTAAKVMGAGRVRVLVREILPGVVPPVLSFGFVIVAVLIVADGSLSYLGLGLSPPAPTWGNMIAEVGIPDLRTHPILVLVPGAFMFLTVYSLNRLGRALQHEDLGRVA